MAPIQKLRAILHALSQPSGLAGDAGSFMRSGGAAAPAAPSAAIKAAFKQHHAAVLVDPSGQYNIAATLSQAELHQVGVLTSHLVILCSRPCV